MTTAGPRRAPARRDVRACRWYEELAEYLSVDPALLEAAVPDGRPGADRLPPAARAARTWLTERFMSPEAAARIERIRRLPPGAITDTERSEAWKEYVFVCVNGEKRAFQRLPLYEALLAAVVRPIAEIRPRPLVVDYGCGSSLLTRLIAQDLGDRVRTLSVDVCRIAVEFSVARNRVYSPAAQGLVIEDVLAPLPVRGADLILAYAVLEHLPDAAAQVRGLIDALAPGGILVENYSGHSADLPQKSDTLSASRGRDANLDLLAGALALLHGRLPARRDGVWDRDRGDRVWMKPPVDADLARAVRAGLRREGRLLRRVARRLARSRPGR